MSAFAADLSAPPSDPRLADQDAVDGVEWTVRQWAQCREDGVVRWEETDILETCHTQGDAVYSAWLAAVGWGARGVGLRANGRGGTWSGSDGSTQVRIHVLREVASVTAGQNRPGIC